MSALVWIDVETTGLDPHAGRLLEIAAVYTTPDLEEIGHVSHVVQHDPRSTRLLCDAYVTEMHTRNGLFDELPRGIPLRDAEESVAQATQLYGGRGSPLCGASVHFDRDWLRVHAPGTLVGLHYRNFDVSTLMQAADLWRVPYVRGPAPTDHRALSDIRATIALARVLREAFCRP